MSPAGEIVPSAEPKGGTGDESTFPAKVTRPLLPSVFQRQRLFDKLDHMRRKQVIWVSGPAGCGKTALISSYLEARALPCLWYNVDERDLDPATFFYYMGLSAKQANPRNLKPLPFLTPEYQAGLVTFTLRYFENLYNRLKSPCIVVFDNYQELPSEAKLHELLYHSLAPIPEGITVMMISREAPPGFLSRMRANRLMEELRWHDMQLTLEETREIVDLQVRDRFSKREIERIHRATGGWAAGLILMLVRARMDGFEFGGEGDCTREEIFSYFVSEVFDKLDPEDKDFLLKTAFLPHMTPKMAGILTGHAHAERILFQLNRRHLFTEKCGHDGLSYQYHPLFREFLLSRARVILSPEALTVSRRDAARLLISSGEIEEAVLLLHDAKEWDSLVKLILDHAPSMLEQGRARLLGSWLQKLPNSMREDMPWVQFWMGACIVQSDPASSQSYFERAFEKFRAQGDKRGVFLALACIVNSSQLGREDFRPLSKWLIVLEELLHEFEGFSHKDIEALVILSKLVALVSIQPGHPEMEALIEQSISMAEGNLNNNGIMRLLHNIALFRICTGDFEKAAAEIEKITQLASSESVSPIAIISAKLMSSTYFQVTGRHKACMKAVKEGLELSRKSGAFILDGMLLGIGILDSLNVNDFATARNMLEELASFKSDFKTWDRAFYYYLRFNESLWLGDFLKAADDAASALKYSIKVGSYFSINPAYLANARAMHELGRHEEASEHLQHVFRIAEQTNSLLMKFHALLNEAQFLMVNGEEESGLKSLRKALEIGKSKGYVTTDCMQPTALSYICVKALEEGIEVSYVQDLIKSHNLAPSSPPLHLENWPWPLKIYTLGRFSLVKDGVPLHFSTKAQKVPLKMLTVLLAFGGRNVRKEKVSDVLWPNAEGDKADQAFRTALHRLRYMLRDERAVQLQGGKLDLNPSYCWVDIWSFERLFSQADEEPVKNESNTGIRLIEKAVDIYNGPFLAGDEWEPWAVSQRERLEKKFILAISSIGRHLEKTGKFEQAVQCYFRGLDSDVLSESIHQRLMLCLRRLGHRTEALAVYNSFRKSLKASLGLEPSRKTEAIYRSMLADIH